MNDNIFDRLSKPTEPERTDAEPPEQEANHDSLKPTPDSAIETGTDKQVKDATQELLRRGYIEESHKSTMFRNVITHEHNINSALEPLDLMLQLDTHRGVAWLAVAGASTQSLDGDVWSHPLVRRQRLTLEQSLLVALLRQVFVMHEQKEGIGQSTAKIATDELLPQFLTYFQDSGSDAKNESRLLSLLDQLKTYGIVTEIDKNQEVSIRPMIAHLANPESLNALLQTLKAQAAANSGTSSHE